MGRINRRALVPLIALPLLLLGAGAIEQTKEADDGLDVYFRDMDLSAETAQELPKYPTELPGESKKLMRGFHGAPPQISHTVEDMLPITLDDNECLDCHHPDNTVSKKDIPLPKTHFKRPVMGEGKKGSPMAWVVKGYEDSDQVGGRFNCTTCHTPQATNVKTPANALAPVPAPKK